ncbi:MAG: T9SS type A sorting domain-containing protein [Bacteroidales bacterium]|jgi:hypothetical protein|nr:T9SS type A sorting domain-containing protein [Bacteroidales bacterium]
MKKIKFFLFSFSFLFSAVYINAQPFQLPDSGFETGWILENSVNGSYDEYKTDFFYTLNSLHALENDPLPADLTAFKDPNFHSGDYCIKLVTGIIPLGENIIILPGMVGTINKAFVEEFLGSDGEVTITCEWDYDTPLALEGYYKYIPVAGDSALIDIGFSNYDKEIFVEKLIIKNTVNEWTKFSIPIPEQYLSDYYNRIRVLFVASAAINFDMLMFCEGQKGSTLWIDDIYLNYGDGIKQNLFSNLFAKAYPNPATEVLNVELNESFVGTISIYNISGSKVIEENINGTQCQLNTSTLASGNYIYKIMKENTIFAQGKFVVVK